MSRDVQAQNPEAWARGPIRDQPRRLGVTPWPAFVARGYRFPSGPRPPKTWRETVTPLGPCLSCGLPCVVQWRGAPVHPACPDPRERES